ncbi:Hsp70 family protein [Rugosimonospora africana]|uniref:Molecular chaperone DnaK n=1 Tax=Rugosimonospora africana TaxID=556532 RepID=A0A8J3VTB8_9ACTN|nr:Hsp70 family protein [Rugosimonospora africana]GIH18267.1 molecular chaperone DnaK [Rugosimonospora africana]
MPYVLGIDLGGWRTAAAVSRLVNGASGAGGWTEAEAFPLGTGTSTIPSVLYVLPDGSIHAGEAGQALAGKGRAVLGFGRRVGDDVPLIIDGEPYTGQALLASLALWVVDRVEEREGGRAEHIVVTHPGGWGPYRVELLHRALWRAGLDAVTLLPAPVVAAEEYVVGTPVGAGAVLAVQDFGGGESALVRRTDVGTFELLGCSGNGVDSDPDGYPGGIEPLLDDALLGYVGEQLRVGFDSLDPTDPLVRDGIVRVREECAAARELLTTAAEANITVDLPPSLVTRVPITRASFEELVRPLLFTATDALRRMVAAAGLAPGELAGVVLSGDAARTPLVSALVAAVLPVRVAVGPQPELRVAKGAALAARYAIDRPVNLPAARTGEIVEYGDARAVEPVAGQDVEYVEDYRPRPDPRPRPGHRPRPYGAGQRFGDYDADDDIGEAPPRPPVYIAPLNLPKRGKRWLRRDSQE